MRNIIIPNGLTGFEAVKWIASNRRIIIAERKMKMKMADAVCFAGSFINKSGELVKAAAPIEPKNDVITNSTVINTCLWYDSHGDVHLPGIWKHSLAMNAKKTINDIPLIQEHQMRFDKIIADGGNVRPYTKTMAWRELGVDVDGETEALIFDNTISIKRNPFMFNQYREGYVKNHSVGMYYDDYALAIGYEHKDYKEQNELFYKWIDQIPNKEEAIEDGMFWAVAKAKAIEGSSVVRGSNTITPTLAESKHTVIEPGTSTQEQPSPAGSDFFKQLINSFKA